MSNYNRERYNERSHNAFNSPPSNHLPEWRQALNIAIENYQSTRSWYEQNLGSPSAEQDMDAAAGEIEKLIRQYGVLMVLTLLDEIDELQEHQKAVASHFQCGYDDVHSRGLTCGKLYKAHDQMRQHRVAFVKAYNDQLTSLGASHPANGPLTVERIIRIIKELQSSIQYQNGGEMAYVIPDGIKGPEELLVSRETASGPIGHNELDHLIWGLERYGLYPQQLAALIELRELRKIMLQKMGHDN